MGEVRKQQWQGSVDSPAWGGPFAFIGESPAFVALIQVSTRSRVAHSSSLMGFSPGWGCAKRAQLSPPPLIGQMGRTGTIEGDTVVKGGATFLVVRSFRATR